MNRSKSRLPGETWREMFDRLSVRPNEGMVIDFTVDGDLLVANGITRMGAHLRLDADLNKISIGDAKRIMRLSMEMATL